MAAAFRAATNTVATGVSATPAEPAGTVAGDVMLVVYATAPGAAPAVPVGWFPYFGGLIAKTEFSLIVAVAARGASAPSYAFTHTGSVYYERCLMAISGADTGSPNGGAAQVSQASAPDVKPNPPSLNPSAQSVGNGLGIAIGINWQGSVTSAWSLAGYTVRSRNTIGDDIAVATKTTALANPEDPAAITCTGVLATHEAWAATIAINGAFARRTTRGAMAAHHAATWMKKRGRIFVPDLWLPTPARA